MPRLVWLRTLVPLTLTLEAVRVLLMTAPLSWVMVTDRHRHRHCGAAAPAAAAAAGNPSPGNPALVPSSLPWQ